MNEDAKNTQSDYINEPPSLSIITLLETYPWMQCSKYGNSVMFPLNSYQ